MCSNPGANLPTALNPAKLLGLPPVFDPTNTPSEIVNGVKSLAAGGGLLGGQAGNGLGHAVYNTIQTNQKMLQQQQNQQTSSGGATALSQLGRGTLDTTILGQNRTLSSVGTRSTLGGN